MGYSGQEMKDDNLRVSILESFRSTGSVGISSLRAEKAVFTLKVRVNHKLPERRRESSRRWKLSIYIQQDLKLYEGILDFFLQMLGVLNMKLLVCFNLDPTSLQMPFYL